jgi:hypothetical protein
MAINCILASYYTEYSYCLGHGKYGVAITKDKAKATIFKSISAAKRFKLEIKEVNGGTLHKRFHIMRINNNPHTINRSEP